MKDFILVGASVASDATARDGGRKGAGDVVRKFDVAREKRSDVGIRDQIILCDAIRIGETYFPAAPMNSKVGFTQTSRGK